MVEIFDDIRKIYKFSSPCEELKTFIEFFSESSAEKTSLHIATEKFTVKMFESWTPTIWFNLGAPYQLSAGNKTHHIKKNDDILLLRNTEVIRHVSDSDHIFSIKFFPGGLEAILGLTQVNLKDQIININSIISKTLIEKIKKAACFEERVALLQNYFLERFQGDIQRDHYLKIVQDIIVKHTSESFQLNTNQSAEKMFLTSKTINRYFNKVVGVGPKKYFSVVRARTALTNFVANRSVFDPTQFGYYDMSHFYKAIKDFTGQSMPAMKD